MSIELTQSELEARGVSFNGLSQKQIPLMVSAWNEFYAEQYAVKTGPCVYLIRMVGTNLYKIGYSTDTNKRLSNLGTASPFELELVAKMPGTAADERALHQKYNKHLVRNEWFHFPNEDIFYDDFGEWGYDPLWDSIIESARQHGTPELVEAQT